MTTSPSPPKPLLLASLGNPPAYTHTRHSAGHTLLHALHALTTAPALDKSPRFPKTLSALDADSQTLFIQPLQEMNILGGAVHTAWKTYSAAHPDALLVILHDELELPVGRFKMSTGAGRSPKGHNGLKSVLAQPGMQTVTFTRVGVGIGPRPASRGSDDVARFVLSKFREGEEDRIQGLAMDVWRGLERLR